MNLFQFTPQAEADLFDIWSYTASDNLESAGRVEHAIYEACAFIADGPMRGRTRPDLTSLALRFWMVPRYPTYIIVYDPATSPLQIIRILHGSRDLKRLLNTP